MIDMLQGLFSCFMYNDIIVFVVTQKHYENDNFKENSREIS